MEERTSFCEQKAAGRRAAKKFLLGSVPGGFTTARSGAKVFGAAFFKKRLLDRDE
jgi:hypothetical protein